MSKKSNRRHHSSQSFARNFVSIIFSFLLAVVFTLIGLLAAAAVLRTPTFVGRSFDSTYYTYVRNYVEEAAADYTLPTSIATSVIDGVFTETKIAQDTSAAIQTMFAGETFTPDTTELESALTTNVEAFFYSEEQTGGDTDAIISAYVDEIMDIYRSAFNFPGLSALVRMSNQYGKFIWFGLAAAVIFAIILILLCIRMHHWVHRGLRYVAYASGGAFLMSLVAPLVLYVTRLYERLQILPQYFYYCLMNFIKHGLELLLLAALCWLLITLILAIVIRVKRRRAIRGIY